MSRSNAKKIIFLDLDEVLSGHRVNMAYGSMKHIDPVGAKIISNICEVSDAKVVFTSVRAQEDSERDLAAVLGWMEKAGFDNKHIHRDWSCRYDSSSKREHHICRWMKEHPEVEQMVVVDDGLLNIHNLVQVDGRFGLMHHDALRICEILDVDPLRVIDFAQRGVRLPAAVTPLPQRKP